MRIAENAPAQRGQKIDGQTAQRVQRRRGGSETRGEGDQEGCECGAQPGCVQPGYVHARAAAPTQPGVKRSSRLTTGALPVMALASTLKMSLRLPSVAL